MKISQHLHQRIRIKNSLLTLIILLLICSLAWLSQHYDASIDLTIGHNNTLSTASQKILKNLPEAVSISAYIKQPQLQKQLAQLLTKYQRFKADIEITFINPDKVPDKVREFNIGPQGAFIVEYRNRSKKIDFLDESTLSNALLQLSHTSERRISFLSGHGERSIFNQGNSELSIFAEELKKHKFQLTTLKLSQQPSIPADSSLLVIASPKTALLPAELNIIRDYIEQGGNLLLLTEPNTSHLSSLEQQLGLQKLPGTVVDSNAKLYGLDNPSFLLISGYPRHPISANFNSMTIFPLSAAFELNGETEFSSQALLSSSNNAWNETSVLTTHMQFDVDSAEKQGPLNIAYAFSRQYSENKQQRILVIGDADFLSNAYLGQVGNSELGFRLINWLSDNDLFIAIPPKTVPGKSLQLSKPAIASISFGFLFVLPFILISTGFIIWRKRKQR